MSSWFAALRSVFTARLSRQLGLWVFAGILGIEGVIFLPSVYRRQDEQLQTIARTSTATITALAIAEPDIHKFTQLLPQLRQDAPILGSVLYDANGTLVHQAGHPETVSFAQAKTLQQQIHYDTPWRYQVAHQLHLHEGDYYLLIHYDVSLVAQDLIQFSGRILGLILLISASVTILMMWIVNQRLIHPILLLQSDVKVAGEAVDQAQPFEQFSSRLYKTQNELQDVIQAVHQTHSRMMEAIAVRKQSESNLKQTAEQLQVALQDLQCTQAQVIHAEKMSSLGQLSAGFAHEVNNPINFIHANLTYVANYSQDLLALVGQYQQELPQPSPPLQDTLDEVDLDFIQQDMPRLVQSMQTGAERIRDLVTSFRNFTRLDESAQKTVDLHQGLESTLNLLQDRLASTHLRPTIQIQRAYGELPQVICYPSQINQVFFYLLMNAIESIDRRSQLETLTQPLITLTTSREEQQVAIAIHDNGTGIAPEIQPKIFDPFFTTKDIGQGMGLGLTNSYHIVTELHRGTLSVDSIPQHSATLILRLPCS